MNASSQILVGEDDFGKLGMDIDTLHDEIAEIVNRTPPHLLADGPIPGLLAKVNQIGHAYGHCLPDPPQSDFRASDSAFTGEPEPPWPLNPSSDHG